VFNYFGLIYSRNVPFFWRVTNGGTDKGKAEAEVIMPKSVTCRLITFIVEKWFPRGLSLTTKLVKFTSNFFGNYIKKDVMSDSSYFRARRQLISQKIPKIVTRSLLSQGLIRIVFQGSNDVGFFLLLRYDLILFNL
jgi:hypothetical protein